MKIALIRRRFSPTGGAERYLERLAEELLKNQIEVELWCETWTNPSSVIKNITTIASDDPWMFAEKIQKIKNNVDLRFSLDRVPGVEVYRAGDGLHRTWLHNRELYSPLKGWIQNRIRPKNNQLKKLDDALYRSSELKLVIANSSMVADEIYHQYPLPKNKITVIHNGIPLGKFQNGNRSRAREAMGVQPDDYVILLVGAGRERKGHRYLKEAYSRMIPPAKLWIIDSPPPVPIEDIYAGSDVFVLPTLYDPFSNVVLEALASGKPVITTRHNGAHEILQNGIHGWILDRANETEKLRHYLEIFADPKTRAPFEQAALKLSLEYSIEKNVAQTLSALQKL